MTATEILLLACKDVGVRAEFNGHTVTLTEGYLDFEPYMCFSGLPTDSMDELSQKVIYSVFFDWRNMNIKRIFTDKQKKNGTTETI